MKRVFLLLVIGLGQTALAMAGSVVGKPEAGQAKAAVCGACHAQGGGIAPNYPNLGGQGVRYLIKQITDIKNKVRVVPEMAGMVDNLTEQDIADIASWYADQPAVQGQASPDLVAIGERLFRFGDPEKGIAACTACHSPLGQGNPLAGFPQLAGQSPVYLEKQLHDFANPLSVRETARSNDGDSRIMRATAEKLSDLEIKALSSYISGLRPAKGAVGSG